MRQGQEGKTRTPKGLPGEKTLALVDYFLFLLDSRIPDTSLRLSEPYLRKKRRIYIFTKPDLADPKVTERWIQHFQAQKHAAFQVNCFNGQGLSDLIHFLKEKKAQLDAKMVEKGFSSEYERPLRLMLFGLPNVGKSSLANRLLGVKKAPFGAKPGLTRGAHWLKGSRLLEILDTPGVLDTSKVDDETRLKLAATWAIPESAYDAEEVGLFLAKIVFGPKDYPRLLGEFGQTRSFLTQGGNVDMERTYRAFIKAFRHGELGRISLELPPQ